MAYVPFYSQWKDWPDVSTPITAAAMQHIEAGIVAGGGTGTVNSVTAGDTSVVIGGTSTDPTIETGTLDAIATDHPPAANWSNNSKKITNVAAATATTDAVQGGQLFPTLSSIAFASSVTPALPSLGDAVYNVGTLTGNITINNPSGTPADGQTIRFRIAQDGTGGRAITWGGGYVFGTDVTTALIPTSASSTYELLFSWYATGSVWRALAIARGF